MKRFILLLFIGLMCLGISKAQNGNCNGPLAQYQYNQRLQQLSNLMNEQMKLQRAKQIATTHCLTTQQVRGFAQLFLDDYARLDFAETAYQNTLDKENFYDVFDAFAYFSNVFRLHDFIWEQTHNNTPNTPPPGGNTTLPVGPTIPIFPDLTYPNFTSYNGPSACTNPINEDQFNAIVQQIMTQQTDVAKVAVATNLSLSNCMTTIYAMKIATLLSTDQQKVNYLKSVWGNIYDQNNFGAAAQVVQNQNMQADFTSWVQSMQTPVVNNPGTPSAPPPCGVSPAEYDNIKASIKKESFNNTRINTAKMIIKNKQCFTSQQIKGIVALFYFESAKLEVAKYAYDYCIDKENYYVVNDAFSFSSSKNELIKFINSKQ